MFHFTCYTHFSSRKNKEPFQCACIPICVPVSCLQVSVLVNVLVEKNGQPLGKRSVKCESRMRELDQLIRSLDNPLNFLCQVRRIPIITRHVENKSNLIRIFLQTFGLNPADREQLDMFLVTAYVKNVPPNFHLLQPSGSRYQYCEYSISYYAVLSTKLGKSMNKINALID